MCFSQEMSGAFSILGLACAFWVYKFSGNWSMTIGVLYFVLMEVLQYFQFFYINECDNEMNKWLTIAGFLHICFQPYFTHLMNFAMMRSQRKKHYGEVVRKLAVLQGIYMFSRFLFPGESINQDCGAMDWISGDKVCTYMGNYHLAWQLPLRNATYFWPTNNTHFFMMFAPFLAVDWKMWAPGFILFLSGPYLANYITDNLHEQASIWCFFSIAQICVLVTYVYIMGGVKRADKDSNSNKSKKQ